LKTTAELRPETPFVATPSGERLLYLWPLLLARRSEYTGRHTLWVFQEIPDGHRPFLSRVRLAAIDVPEDWSAELHTQPAASHAWLLARLRDLPPAPLVPRELALAERLFPARGGKLVGRQLGSNRLLSVVAVGGYGTIYAAETIDGQRLAVKVIETRASGVERARFSQEIEKSRLAAEHPGIIRCYEYGDVDLDGRICPWYSMEFAHGGDLRSRMDARKGRLKGRPPWEDEQARAEVCREFSDIAAAVAHLHRLGIVHRDVKPGNVLILQDGSLRLSDFGLVKNLRPSEGTRLRGPQTETGGGVGTPGYMAPEQARGEEVGEAADVYALGVLLAELTLGERPRAEPRPDKGGKDGAASGTALKGGLQSGTLPRGLRRLIERCTDTDPERRPRDAQAVLDEFVRQGHGPGPQGAAAEPGGQARPSGPPAEPSQAPTPPS
jgi:serine/threonine protein kinase